MGSIHPMRFDLHLDSGAIAYLDDLANTLDTDWPTALSVLLCLTGKEFLREQRRSGRRRSPQPTPLRLVMEDND